MECPYCGKEMETGSIQSPRELFWHPGEKSVTFARAKFYRGSVVLSKLNFWKGSKVTAYFCRDCGKIIINCPAGAASLPYL